MVAERFECYRRSFSASLVPSLISNRRHLQTSLHRRRESISAMRKYAFVVAILEHRDNLADSTTILRES